MKIINKSTTHKGKIIEKIINKHITELPTYILDILKEYKTNIIIGNLKNELKYKFNYEGCYEMRFEKNEKIAYVYINDSNPLRKIKLIFGHEIGHLLDEVIGCKKNNVDITKENIKIFSLSTTNDKIRTFIRKESDFFTQITPSKDEKFKLLEEYDIEEEFANCVAEILANKRRLKMLATKQVILENVKH